jgi:hypothetical protein
MVPDELKKELEIRVASAIIPRERIARARRVAMSGRRGV